MGKSYDEIQDMIGVRLPKSTISYWCRGIELPTLVRERIISNNRLHLVRARELSRRVKRAARDSYLNELRESNDHLAQVVEHPDTGKIALAMLYLGEGAKMRRRNCSVMFGNSDPGVISLFLKLLRKCFSLEESKFRCTVQCRADQDTEELERFWAGVTKIPRSQFYRTRIDPRTVGKPSRKPSYKGVCRLDYFSAGVFNEIMSVIDIIIKGR
jgi:hypothetical protein